MAKGLITAVMQLIIRIQSNFNKPYTYENHETAYFQGMKGGLSNVLKAQKVHEKVNEQVEGAGAASPLTSSIVSIPDEDSEYNNNPRMGEAVMKDSFYPSSFTFNGNPESSGSEVAQHQDKNPDVGPKVPQPLKDVILEKLQPEESMNTVLAKSTANVIPSL